MSERICTRCRRRDRAERKLYCDPCEAELDAIEAAVLTSPATKRPPLRGEPGWKPLIDWSAAPEPENTEER